MIGYVLVCAFSASAVQIQTGCVDACLMCSFWSMQCPQKKCTSCLDCASLALGSVVLRRVNRLNRSAARAAVL